MKIFVAGIVAFTALAQTGHAQPVSGGKALFHEVQSIVRSDFVDAEGSNEDARYSAALRGMLKELGKNNQLLTPKELKWMKGSVKGTVAGIGIVFEKVEDLVVVKEVLPGAPAAKTKIGPRDRILTVDGKALAESTVAEVAQLIRGPIGSSVELLMQRGTEEWTETITRASVTVRFVHDHVRADGVGYLRITSFTETVPDDVTAALARFEKRNVQMAVLDLRGCPGGLYKASLAVADAFLAPGQTIVTTKHRSGEERIEQAKVQPGFQGKLVVLVDESSASSSEIVAAALRENDRATVVGEKTFGKGTIERVFELSGGYGLKLTVARFYSPKGNNWQDQGLTPDFVIPSDYVPYPTYTKDPKDELHKDPQLRAALNLLNL